MRLRQRIAALATLVLLTVAVVAVSTTSTSEPVATDGTIIVED